MVKNKKLKELQGDEVSLYDFLLSQVDGMKPAKKQELIQVLMMLLACAEGDQLNMNKVAALVDALSDGQMKFTL